jgi:hypothetical protein
LCENIKGVVSNCTTLCTDKVGYIHLNYLKEHPSEEWQITPAKTYTLVVNAKYFNIFQLVR